MTWVWCCQHKSQSKLIVRGSGFSRWAEAPYKCLHHKFFLLHDPIHTFWPVLDRRDCITVAKVTMLNFLLHTEGFSIFSYLDEISRTSQAYTQSCYNSICWKSKMFWQGQDNKACDSLWQTKYVTSVSPSWNSTWCQCLTPSKPTFQNRREDCFICIF